VEVDGEVPITFPCAGETLVGILNRPDTEPTIGVVIVVGGPQYRAGAHREFVLMARDLACRGVAILRFDCRGMGDSDGAFPGFEHIEQDIAAAVEALVSKCPTVQKLVLFGLCDATCEISTYAQRDPRVTGVVLVNPWVRTVASYARTQLKHYYLARLFQREVLRKILRGEFRMGDSVRDLLRTAAAALSSLFHRSSNQPVAPVNYLAEHMASNLLRFRGRVLIIVSGRDLTAKEFEEAAHTNKKWQMILRQERAAKRRLTEADHTFARREWRDQMIKWVAEWVTDVRQA
jgi:uncharacterized protein